MLHNFCISRRIPVVLDADVVDRNAAIQPATVAANQDTAAVAGQNAVQIRRSVVQQL